MGAVCHPCSGECENDFLESNEEHGLSKEPKHDEEFADGFLSTRGNVTKSVLQGDLLLPPVQTVLSATAPRERDAVALQNVSSPSKHKRRCLCCCRYTSRSVQQEGKKPQVLELEPAPSAFGNHLPFVQDFGLTNDATECCKGFDMMELQAKLRSKLDEIFDLCRALQIHEAGSVLADLDRRVKALNVHHLLPVLQTDPILVKLRAVHLRMEQALTTLVVPVQRKDVEWSSLEITDPAIPGYSLELNIRCAEGNEWKEGGPSSQFIVGARVKNFPMSVVNRVALEREADLFKQTWIKDCKLFEASLGGREQLFSVLLRLCVAPWLLPFKFEDVSLREFSVCSKPPMSGLPTGVLKIETAPPTDVSEFEGWIIPHTMDGYVRNDGTKLFYISPSSDPKCCDVQIFAQGGVPVPQNLLPLFLVKRILGAQITNTLKNIIGQILPSWAENKYNDRIASCPEFYGPVAAIASCVQA